MSSHRHHGDEKSFTPTICQPSYVTYSNYLKDAIYNTSTNTVHTTSTSSNLIQNIDCIKESANLSSNMEKPQGLTEKKKYSGLHTCNSFSKSHLLSSTLLSTTSLNCQSDIMPCSTASASCTQPSPQGTHSKRCVKAPDMISKTTQRSWLTPLIMALLFMVVTTTTTTASAESVLDVLSPQQDLLVNKDPSKIITTV